MSEDYIIRQIKSMGRVIAALLGLVEKGEKDAALEASEHALQTVFELKKDFSITDIQTLFDTQKLSVDDLKQLLLLLNVRLELLENENIESETSRAINLIDFIQKNATTYDFEVAQTKQKILKKISNLKKS